MEVGQLGSYIEKKEDEKAKISTETRYLAQIIKKVTTKKEDEEEGEDTFYASVQQLGKVIVVTEDNFEVLP